MRILLPLLLLTGCAGTATSNAPSLLPREIERRTDAPGTPPPAPAAADPALDGAIAEKIAAFDRAVAAFDATVRTAEPRIVRGARAREGSEAWLDAQLALGEIDTARVGVSDATAALDELAIARGSAGAVPYPALEAAITRAGTDAERVSATAIRLSDLFRR